MPFESFESCEHGWTSSYAMLNLCKGLHVSQSESTLSPSGSSSCSSTPPRSNSKSLRDYGSVRHGELWKWLWLDFSTPVSSEVPRLIRKNMRQCSRNHLDLEMLEPICEKAVGLSQSNSSLFKEGSTGAAVFTLVSSAMGAGCLSLPFMLKTAGIIPGLFMLALGAVLAHLSLVVLMSCARYTESDSFSQLVALTMDSKPSGRPSRIVDVVIAVYGIAAVLCYLMFIGDFFLGIAQSPVLQLNLSRETLIVVISLVVVWPLSLPRNLSALRHVCVLSVAAICLTAIAVALKTPGYAKLGSVEADADEWRLVWWKSDPYAMLQSFSIALFSFAAHTNAVPVATSLKQADGASIWTVSLYSHTFSWWNSFAMNDDDLFDLDEGPPLLEKMEMNQEPVLQSEDVRMPTAHETSRCPAASSSEAFKPVTAHDSLTGTPGYETSPGMFRQADPTPLPRAFHDPPAPAPAPYVQSPGFYPEAVYSMVAPVTPGVPMDVTPYTPQILRPRYPHDPHTKLRRAVQRNDRETLIQALHEGGGAKPCKAGKTAMHYAADAGNVEFMSILLQSGLNPQATSNAGHTLVDEAEYWVVKASLNGNREMMENCRQCRNIVAVFGGRRGYHKDVVSQRLALERSCHAQGRGEKFPWEDDLDYIAKS
eukprot:symbB.v1.2.022172.t1/scaffold1956.1/size94972/3